MSSISRSAPRFAAVFLIAALAAPSLIVAQTAPAGTSGQTDPSAPVTLDAIFARLQENIADYDRSVPSFFSSEHAVSEMENGSDITSYKQMTADSIFRVRRTTDSGQPSLDESRVINTIDGKPQADESAKIDSPLAVFGIFSGALKVVSPAGKPCFQYRLHPPRKGHETDNLVIDFSSLSPKERGADCQYLEKTSGKVFIDPISMRVVHMDTKTNNHEISPGVRGTWNWSIDYSRVALNGKTFWLPSMIRSTAITEPPDTIADSAQPTNYGAARGTAAYDHRSLGTTSTSKGPVTYHLLERYTDYHLLTVESKIVPASGSATAP